MERLSPEDDELFRQWLAERQAAQRPAEVPPEPEPVAAAPPEPEPGPEPVPEDRGEIVRVPGSYIPGYSRSQVNWQAAVGADVPQPAESGETGAHPSPVDHLARAHAAGGHQGAGAAVSN